MGNATAYIFVGLLLHAPDVCALSLGEAFLGRFIGFTGLGGVSGFVCHGCIPLQSLQDSCALAGFRHQYASLQFAENGIHRWLK